MRLLPASWQGFPLGSRRPFSSSRAADLMLREAVNGCPGLLKTLPPQMLTHIVLPLDRSSSAPGSCAVREWPFSGPWVLGPGEGLDKSGRDKGHSVGNGGSGWGGPRPGSRYLC